MDQPERDPPPWEALITEHIRRDAGFFYRLAQRIVGRSAAEDACQQAFLNVWQQRHHLREPQRLRAYLAQVVVRESLQILRRRKRRQQALANHACQFPSSGPASASQRLALRESLLLALDELDADVRMAVVLRLIQGLSGREVSRMLKCSDAQVSRRLHRGMEQLRDRLRDWQPTPSRTEETSEGGASRGKGVER